MSIEGRLIYTSVQMNIHRMHFTLEIVFYVYLIQLLGYHSLKITFIIQISYIWMQGPELKAATELIRIDGVLDAILRHLRKS